MLNVENDNIIFLDIDGVLNSQEWYKSRKFDELQMRNSKDKHEAYIRRQFSEDLVDNLKFILEKTDAKIVISSSWRVGRDLKELKGIFSRFGIEDKVIAKTRRRETTKEKRGDQIEDFIKEHNIKNYVIIDDSVDMLDHQKPNFVITNILYGLTPNDAFKAISILNN